MPTLRAATEADTEFLWKVQHVAVGPYVTAQFGTTSGQQRSFFDEHFTVVEHSIVAVKGVDAGFLLVRDEGDEIYLGNIALLPESQGRGIGTGLVESVLAKASHRAMPVRLRVLRSNPRARTFYERLGFVVVEGTASHLVMRAGPRPQTIGAQASGERNSSRLPKGS